MTATHEQIMHTLATTPMRDVVRGRLSGRLDVERTIIEAGLPEPVAGVVRRVARRTRLTRLERADVARELASHFREGLDAGRGAKELIREFGDPDAAARLIRRSKKRARGPLHKAWTRGWQAIGAATLLLIAAYSIQTVRFYRGSPTVAHDYLAELNAGAAAVPAGERAWPLYERAIAAYVEPPVVEVRDGEAFMDDPYVPVRLEPVKVSEADPGEDDWPLVVGHIHANEATLTLLRRAAERDEMGLALGVQPASADQAGQAPTAAGTMNRGDRVLSGTLLDLLIPHLGDMRRLANLLAADVRLALEEGDAARVVADLAALARMAEHVWAPPTLISQLFSFSMLQMATEHTMYVLHTRPDALTDEQWSSVAHSLAGWRGGGRVAIDFRSERLQFYDLLQRMYTDDGRGGGRLTPDGMVALRSLGLAEGPAPALSTEESLVGPILAVTMADRAGMRREHDRVLDRVEAFAVELPWERDYHAFGREIDERYESLRYQVRYLFIGMLMPSFTRAISQADRVGMMRDAALVSIALELHRRRHGEYPERLGALTPELLPSAPRDIFDGEPIRYARRGESYTLYSIGVDRDDDAGTPVLDRNGDRDVRVSRFTGDIDDIDGDWVLFPPAPR